MHIAEDHGTVTWVKICQIMLPQQRERLPPFSSGLRDEATVLIRLHEVEEVVDAVGVLDVHKERHSEDGKDEHDEEEEEADVDKSRHRDGEREEQCPDAFG